MAASVAWHGVSGDCSQSATHSKKIGLTFVRCGRFPHRFGGVICKVTDVTTDLHLAAAEGRQLARH